MSYNERLRPYGVTLHEALSGTLPTVDILQRGLVDNLRDEMGEERVIRALEAVRFIREKFQPFPGQMVKPRADVFSMLYLDSLEYLGYDALCKGTFRNNQRQQGPKAKNNVLKIITAATLFKNDLHFLVEMFSNVPENVIYNAMDATLYDAGCLLWDLEDADGINEQGVYIKEDAEVPTRMYLTGLLAEFKVFESLKNTDISDVRYGTPFEDMHKGWDVITQVKKRKKEATVPIHIKSTNPWTSIKIEQARDFLKVFVPVRKSESLFSLTDRETKYLVDEINRYANARFKAATRQ